MWFNIPSCLNIKMIGVQKCHQKHSHPYCPSLCRSLKMSGQKKRREIHLPSESHTLCPLRLCLCQGLSWCRCHLRYLCWYMRKVTDYRICPRATDISRILTVTKWLCFSLKVIFGHASICLWNIYSEFYYFVNVHFMNFTYFSTYLLVITPVLNWPFRK